MPKIISAVQARRIRLGHANPDGEVMSKQKSSKDAPGARIEIGIDKAGRKNIADGLSRLLADEYTLYLKTHNFHWNVVGPMFNTLHLMRSEEHTSELQSLMRISYAVFCLKKKKKISKII